MKNSDYSRVIYSTCDGEADTYYKERVEGLLADSAGMKIASIDDAIEAFQCWAIVKHQPDMFDESQINFLEQSAAASYAAACKFVSNSVSKEGILRLFEETGLQYLRQFWQFIVASGAARNISGPEVQALLDEHPECLGNILGEHVLVRAFDDEVRGVLKKHPALASKIIVSRLAIAASNKQKLYLPESLTNDDINAIAIDFLNSDNPNLNYIGVLVDWPSCAASTYVPSDEVRVLAERRKEEVLAKLFEDNSGIRFGCGVVVDMQQKACRGVARDGLSLTHSFSGQWLEAYLDYATIINNCIYVFDYVDATGNLKMPAHKHEESAVIEALSVHILGEYRITSAFHTRNDLCLLETIAYSEFLEMHGRSFEDALEWVYNKYFEEEYGIRGFSLSLPTKETTWIDKCKSLGPEIERASKAYTAYSSRGEIDDAYFKYMRFKSFADVPSLNGKKYVVPGKCLDDWGFNLFSDQSMLAYPEGHNDDATCFFDEMVKNVVTRRDFSSYLHTTIDWLIAKSLVYEDECTRRLMPTTHAACMKLVWHQGAIALKHLGEDDRCVVEHLVANDVLNYCDRLFSPDEAAYLDYMLYDSSFTNSLGLRNRYNHAVMAVEDANADAIRLDYYRMFALLVAITIKINEELIDKTAHGGVEDFVDWPYYDRSVFETACQLSGDKTAAPTAMSIQ